MKRHGEIDCALPSKGISGLILRLYPSPCLDESKFHSYPQAKIYSAETMNFVQINVALSIRQTALLAMVLESNFISFEIENTERW